MAAIPRLTFSLFFALIIGGGGSVRALAEGLDSDQEIVSEPVDSFEPVDVPESWPEHIFGPMPLKALGGTGLIFYQPLAERATTLKEGEMQLGVNLHYAAINDDGVSPTASVDLDGEILRWETRFDYGVTDDLQLSIIVPFHHTTGGFLDSTIDKFHEITELPRTKTEGDNGFTHRIDIRGETVFDLNNDEFALGDIPVQLKWSVITEEEYPVSLALRIGVELPTGNEARSLGSGGIDAGLGFVLEKSFATTSLFLSADYVYLQRAGRFRDAGVDFEDFVFTTAVAAEWRPWDWLGMTAQLDVLTNVIAGTGVRELDDLQILGSLGMSFAVTERVRFRLGFSEDLTSAASADFAAFSGLTWRF